MSEISVFISYSHDSNEHREKVLALSQRLRADGIKTRIDQYINGSPVQGWPRWMLDQLDAATFVLVICTETYYRRFRGHEEPGKGKGVDWEGALITQELYDKHSKTLKFIPVFLSDAIAGWIPEPLRALGYYALTSASAYESLCDFLLGQGGVAPQPVGELRPRTPKIGTLLTFDEQPPANLPISSNHAVAPELPPAPPSIALPRAAPNGTLPFKSPFYIERAAEKRAVELVQDTGITLTIIKPGQSGGSSLVSRLLEVARIVGKRAAYLNFQRLFTNQDFTDAEQFYYRFCVALTTLLKVGDRVEAHWKDTGNLGIGDRCSYYLQYILQQLNGQPLLLAMDEIDRLANAPFKSDFFAMVRNWHNDRAMEPDYERLDLVLITSLELHQLIDDHFQSPFNVGEVERFEDFTASEVAELANRYGLQLDSDQVTKLLSLLGGHPYLHQLALHHLAKSGANVDSLLQQARHPNSPFRAHLDNVFATVNGSPTLLKGVKDLLHPRPLDEAMILQLRRAGYVQRQGNKVQFRCRLYEEYFREQFR